MTVSKPEVLLIGGPDVDARLALMHSLKDAFDISVLGSSTNLNQIFESEGFIYHNYRLDRQVSLMSDFLTLRQLIAILCRLKPQIVHTFDTKPGVWGRLAARLAGIPIIIGTLPGLGSLYVNQDLKTRLIRSLYQPLQKIACQQSDLTIFQNREDARQFVDTDIVTSQKSQVILGSGVSTSLYSPSRISNLDKKHLRAELNISPNERVVTMVSRIIRTKGVLEFVASAQLVRDHQPEVRFLLIGPDDRDSMDCLNDTELAQLNQTVIWPGPRNDIPTILAISDVFVLPSAYREGIPRVLLEAASMGLPIVTTNSPGCNEVVEDGVNGFLIPARDVVALSQAILRLVGDPQRRLCHRFGQLSRQRAIEQFDLKVISEQVKAVYWRLLERKIHLYSEETRL